MGMGRPTKYTDETLSKAVDYIELHEEYGDVVPTVAGLARRLDVCKATLYSWGQDKPEFLDTLARLQDAQERILVNGSLRNELNSNIAKLMLANHNYGDRQRMEHSGELDSTVRIEVVSADG